LRKLVVRGTNPVTAKRQERAESHTKTFAALAERYLREHAHRKKRPRSIAEDERNLRLHILPRWGRRRYDDIAKRDVITLIEEVIAEGKPTAANRVHALISTIFSFAMNVDIVHANPAARIWKRGVERKRTRVLSDDEICLFWQRVMCPPVSRPVGHALKLALLTGMRAGEIAGLSRAEIEHPNFVPPGGKTDPLDTVIPIVPLARRSAESAPNPSSVIARHKERSEQYRRRAQLLDELVRAWRDLAKGDHPRSKRALGRAKQYGEEARGWRKLSERPAPKRHYLSRIDRSGSRKYHFFMKAVGEYLKFLCGRAMDVQTAVLNDIAFDTLEATTVFQARSARRPTTRELRGIPRTNRRSTRRKKRLKTIT
jgi:integrase